MFSLHRESLKLILVDEPPPQGGCVTFCQPFFVILLGILDISSAIFVISSRAL
jgi:hypothetical protein